MAKQESLVQAVSSGKVSPADVRQVTVLLDTLTDRASAAAIWADIQEVQLDFWAREYSVRRDHHWEELAMVATDSRAMVAAGLGLGFDGAKDLMSSRGLPNNWVLVDKAGADGRQVAAVANFMRTHNPEAKMSAIVTEANPAVKPAVEASFAESADVLSQAELVMDSADDLKSVGDRIEAMAERPEGIAVLEMFNAYAPMDVMIGRMRQAFELGDKLGLPVEYSMMVLDKQFDGRTMVRLYQQQIIPILNTMGEQGQLIIQMMKADLQPLGEHAGRIRELMPNWSPEEITAAAGEAGFRLVAEQPILRENQAGEHMYRFMKFAR